MMLQVGDKFRQNFGENPITFEIIAISNDLNEVRVICEKKGYDKWVEFWDDLHNVYSALNIGKYIRIRG